MKVLEVRNLYKSINGKEILKDVDMNVFEGEIYGLLGRNGAGKTTLFRTILDLLKRDRGEVKIFGENLKRENFKDIGVMFEYDVLNPSWSVIDNLKYICYIYGIEENKIKAILDLLDFKYEDSLKKFEKLSKGMKRKISLAAAIIHSPKLIILDEPTSGLDPDTQRIVENFLLNLKSQGKTILFSSHNLYEVQKICDRVGIMKDGEIIIETSLKKRLFVVKGNYQGLEDYKVKHTNMYILDEEIIEEFKIDEAKELNGLEELYFTVVGEK